MLRIENLYKSFDHVPVLHGINMDVSDGELAVVIGPTGAGKTTLMRTVAGLECADSGSIRFNGKDVSELTPPARDVALVFQNFSLYPGWTVRRNLEFPLKAPIRRMKQNEIDQRVTWVAEMLHIEHLLGRNAEQLSGGEMQRVAIGRAIVRRPKLFLLDEPLTNLDAKLREELRVELVVLQRKLGLPMIYVTHDWSEAISMGDRLFVLCDGRILQQGLPEDVYNRPVSPKVARQLGFPETNIFSVTVIEEEVFRDFPETDPMRFHIGTLDSSNFFNNSQQILGVRPEDIDQNGGIHPAQVVMIEESGPQVAILAEWGGYPIRLINEGNLNRPNVGDTIHPRLRMDRVMWWPHC